MTWFGRANASDKGAPIPAPKLSPARAAAIEKFISSGYTRDGIKRPVRDTRHALFLAQAGVIELPK